MRFAFLVAGMVSLGLPTVSYAACSGLGAAADYEKKLRDLGALIDLANLDKIKGALPEHVIVPADTSTAYLVNVVDQYLRDHPFIVFVDAKGCIIEYDAISIETYNELLELNG